MKLREIMKPLGDDVPQAPVFDPELDIASIRPEAIPADAMVYIGRDGVSVGRIRRETLEFVARKTDSTGLATLLDHIEEGVVAVDVDGRIFYANRTYRKLLGVPVGKIIGKMIQDIEMDAALIQVLRSREPIQRDSIVIKTIAKHVSVRMFPLYAGGEFQGAFSIFKDVTDIRNLNREITRITQVAQEYQSQVKRREMDIIGRDPRFARLVSQALVVAKTDASVLIRGENGTGKELLARLICMNSPRADKPFVAVNCSAIPEHLIESELFGYEEGAFTGARKGGKAGKFELADGGTLFLDEIGDMPYAMQSKLLRALQEEEIEKVGAVRHLPVDVRVIAATNQPLEEMIESRRFRRDLFYRLNVIPLQIPPLRERPGDVLLLANYFLGLFNKRYDKQLILSDESYHCMERYGWPGNVRELKNCIEYAVILCTEPVIAQRHLPRVLQEVEPILPVPGSIPQASALPLREALHHYEGGLIAQALEHCGGNRTQAMQSLGLSRRTFYRKLGEHGITDKK